MAITTEDKVAGLYAAFFNRAPDKDGLDGWVEKLDNGTSTLDDIAAGFADTKTFQDTYSSMDNQTFVEAVYENMLGHAGDATGIANQVKALNDGTYTTKADFVSGFVDSALTVNLNDAAFADLSAADKTAAQDRQDQLLNKVQVSEDFVAKLGDNTNVADAANPTDDPAYLASIKILSGVTADDSTTAMATLNAMSTVSDDDAVIADAQATVAAQATKAAADAAQKVADATQEATDASNSAADASNSAADASNSASSTISSLSFDTTDDNFEAVSLTGVPDNTAVDGAILA